MEFVLISSDAASQKLETIERALAGAPRLATVDGPLHLVNLGGLVLAMSGPRHEPVKDEEDHNIILWDGHGVSRSQAFSSGTGAPIADSSINDYLDACLSGERTEMRGVFTAARINVNSKAFTIAVDPLSQYPLMVCQIGHTLIAGNSIYLIEAAARGLGYALTRSTRAGIFETAFGTGAGIDTGFAEVKLLPGNRMITGVGVNSRLVPVSGIGAYAHATYDELLEEASERLMDYMSIVKLSAARGDMFLDLTGGLDSRLSFAAAIGAGIKNLKVFAGGNDTSADKQIAHAIADKYDARIIDFPDNHDKSPLTNNDLARRAVFRSQGSASLYAYSLGPYRTEGIFRVRGGGGEMARTFMPAPSSSLFWKAPVAGLGKISSGEPVFNTCLGAHISALTDKNKQTAARWAYAYCNSAKTHHKLYRASFLRDGTTSVIEGLLARARSRDSMGMDYYLRERCRRHFGLMSRSLNMGYGAFEPLLDPVIVAAASKLGEQDRAAGTLTFDLIAKMAGEALLKVPYAPASLRADMRSALARRLGVREKSLLLSGKLPLKRSSSLFAGDALNLQTSEDAPKDMGKWATALWHNRRYFTELASGLRTDSDMWQYVNRNTLLKTLSGGDYFFKNETTAMRGTRLLHTLVWLHHQEDTTSIAKVR